MFVGVPASCVSLATSNNFDISAVNPSYWSYVHQLCYLGDPQIVVFRCIQFPTIPHVTVTCQLTPKNVCGKVTVATVNAGVHLLLDDQSGASSSGVSWGVMRGNHGIYMCVYISIYTYVCVCSAIIHIYIYIIQLGFVPKHCLLFQKNV